MSILMQDGMQITCSLCSEYVDGGEHVVVDVVAALSVGADVEGLREAELVGAVHLQVAADHHEEAALGRPGLHVGAEVAELDDVVAQRLDLVGDLLEAAVGAARVGHRAALRVEAQQALPLLLRQPHVRVVLLQERSRNLVYVHKYYEEKLK